MGDCVALPVGFTLAIPPCSRLLLAFGFLAWGGLWGCTSTVIYLFVVLYRWCRCALL